MVRYLRILSVAALLTVLTAPAMAENISGRLGVTGHFGFSVPADSENPDGSSIDTDTGFIGGGGLIYGLTKNIAAEIDVTHAAYDYSNLYNPAPVGGSDFSVTNISLGAQYRFLTYAEKKFVPYVGAGLDILVNDSDKDDISDIDTVVGVHLSGGVDYFWTKDLALTAELKGVLAPDADIKFTNGRTGSFDPDSVSMLVGARYFFY